MYQCLESIVRLATQSQPGHFSLHLQQDPIIIKKHSGHTGQLLPSVSKYVAMPPSSVPPPSVPPPSVPPSNAPCFETSLVGSGGCVLADTPRCAALAAVVSPSSTSCTNSSGNLCSDVNDFLTSVDLLYSINLSDVILELASMLILLIAIFVASNLSSEFKLISTNFPEMTEIKKKVRSSEEFKRRHPQVRDLELALEKKEVWKRVLEKKPFLSRFMTVLSVLLFLFLLADLVVEAIAVDSAIRSISPLEEARSHHSRAARASLLWTRLSRASSAAHIIPNDVTRSSSTHI